MSSEHRTGPAAPSQAGRYREGRAEKRHELPMPVKISGLTVAGIVKNISAAGVWIQQAEFRPPIGCSVVVEICPSGAASGIQLRAEVVRYTENDGFAARFVSLGPRDENALKILLEALDDADDDDSVATWTEALVQRLGPDLLDLFSSIAQDEAVTTVALLKQTVRAGSLKISGRVVGPGKETDPE